MAITDTGSRIRIESPAKNGTLSTQGAGDNKITFDTTIATNNGNLATTPSFKGRQVIIRRGDADEETGRISAIDWTGLIGTTLDDWDTPPVSGDTYDVAYGMTDVDTVPGCSQESDSKQYVLTKRLVVGDGTNFGYIGLSRGEVVRFPDEGPGNNALHIANAGRLDVGTLKGEAARSGAVLIFTHDGDGEVAFRIADGGQVSLFAFTLVSMLRPEGIVLDVTHGDTAKLKWRRGNLLGISAPFTHRDYVLKSFLLTKGEIVTDAAYTGWCRSRMDEGIFDAVDTEASDSVKVRISIEDEDK